MSRLVGALSDVADSVVAKVLALANDSISIAVSGVRHCPIGESSAAALAALNPCLTGGPWAASHEAYVVVAGDGVDVRWGGTGVLVERGALGAGAALPFEPIRTCGLSQVASISASASCSGSVTVRFQVFLIDTQSMVY